MCSTMLPFFIASFTAFLCYLIFREFQNNESDWEETLEIASQN